MNFLNPAWLFFALPIITGLIAIYLRKGKNIRKTVSSIYFIKQLPSYSASSRRSFFLPARAILELLLISLLLLTIAGLSLKDKSEQITIVIDNSLSMLARADPSNLQSESVLEVAKKEAISNINYFTNLSKVSVWQTSPKSTNITNGFADLGEAISKIKLIPPSFAEENLQQILQDQAGKKLMFTDFPSDSQQLGGQIVDFGVKKGAKENVAVENIKYDKISNKISVSVRSYLLQPLQCFLNIYSSRNDSDWVKLNSIKISLTKVSTAEISIDYSSEDKSIKALKAKLDSCNRVEGNSLDADDQAWLSFQNSSNKFYIVSAFDLKELNLDQLDSYNFIQINPDSWEQNPKNDSPAIFHRYLPLSLPDSSAIFIYPYESRDWLPSKALPNKVSLIDWDRLNPILRYLSFPKLSLSEVRIFENLPSWSQSFLKSSAGDVGIFGSKNTKNYIALGFEILPFSGKQNLPISILTLNMLDYLFSADSKTNIRSFNFEDEIKDYSILESAIPIEILNIASSKKAFTLNTPALLKLKFKNETSKYLATQQFIDSESNLLNAKSLDFINPKNSSDMKNDYSQENKNSIGLEKWLLIAIMIITLADLLLVLYKKNGAR